MSEYSCVCTIETFTFLIILGALRVFLFSQRHNGGFLGQSLDVKIVSSTQAVIQRMVWTGGKVAVGAHGHVGTQGHPRPSVALPRTYTACPQAAARYLHLQLRVLCCYSGTARGNENSQFLAMGQCNLCNVQSYSQWHFQEAVIRESFKNIGSTAKAGATARNELREHGEKGRSCSHSQVAPWHSSFHL